ncbi:MAG: hypothetical protein ACPIOQ_06845 [Promethearchaeia archaeon]
MQARKSQPAAAAGRTNAHAHVQHTDRCLSKPHAAKHEQFSLCDVLLPGKVHNHRLVQNASRHLAAPSHPSFLSSSRQRVSDVLDAVVNVLDKGGAGRVAKA